MRALVTGGRGFLGSWVLEELERRGHSTDAPTSEEYDLRHEDDAVRMFWEHEPPDVVIHLAAAVGGIGANAASPGRFFHDNAVMGIHLMEAARTRGIGKFVTIGTACMYPEDASIPQVEDDLWSGYPAPATAAYALAKKALLVQGQAYHQQYGFDAVFLIPTNLYGPRDNFDLESGHVIPSLIRRIEEARGPVVLWGTGRPTRDFLFVADAARAIVDAVERYDRPEPVNLGTGVETSIEEVALMIAELMDFEGQSRWDRSHPDGQPRRRLNIARAWDEFGFEAETELRDGLGQTIDWWRAR